MKTKIISLASLVSLLALLTSVVYVFEHTIVFAQGSDKEEISPNLLKLQMMKIRQSLMKLLRN